MEKVKIEAKKREVINKSARSALRQNGRVPGVFYSKHNEPLAIDVSERTLHPFVFTSKTHLISLIVDGHEDLDCIIKDVQFDPVTDKIVHFDLLGLTKGEKVEIEVPILFTGNPVGIKEGGILQQVLHKLDIACLPTDIPEHLEINVADLKLGDAIHVKDLNYENIDILNNEEAVVVQVTHPKVEKEPVPAEEGAAAEITEPEVIAKGKAQEEEE